MKGEDVDFSVAKALFQALSGFKGYPRPGLGEEHFVEAFQASVVSVAHARAVLASFDGVMPTIREIKDSAFNLRPKFENTVDQLKEWEAKYGPPDPMWSANLIGKLVAKSGKTDPLEKSGKTDPLERARRHAEERRAMLWQAIRDSLYYTEGPGKIEVDNMLGRDERNFSRKFWREAAQRNKENHPVENALFRIELEASSWKELMKFNWESGPPAPAPVRQVASGAVAVLDHPITAEDVQRELRAQGREPGDE
jgi:hypothetical protein